MSDSRNRQRGGPAGGGRGGGQGGRGGGYDDRGGGSGGGGGGGVRRFQSASDRSSGGDYRRGGGDGGRGRGRGASRAQSSSPVRCDVRNIAKTVAIKAEYRNKVHGKEGRPVDLIANHFPIKFNEKVNVFRYDIEINLHRTDGNGMIVIVGADDIRVRKDRQMENRRIIDKMAEQWIQNGSRVLQPNSYVFDGAKNLYTNFELNCQPNQMTRTVTITLDGFPEQTFEVNIKFVKRVPMEAINSPRAGSGQSPEFSEARQVLDIVQKDRAQQTLVTVGRNFFSRDPKDRIDLQRDNCSIGFGHHQSIHVTESGLTANIDRVTTVFKSDGPLIDFIGREFNKDLSRQPLAEREVRRLIPKIRNLKIFTTHIVINNVQQKRKHTIETMVTIKPYEHRFEMEPGRSVTLEEYFRLKYNKVLRFREIPLIKIKGGTRDNPKYLPVEVCNVYPDQTMSQSLIREYPEIQRQIVESTNTQTPLKRFDKIETSVNSLITDSKDLMANFGMTVSPVPIKLKGRELSTPKLKGSDKGLHKTIPLEQSLFLNLSPDVKPNLEQHFDNFFNHPGYGLIKTAQGLGFKVKLPLILPTDYDLSSTAGQKDGFKKYVDKVLKTKYSSAQLIFVCIPDNSELYDYIKHYSENRPDGLLTQCIKDKLFMNTKPGYFKNFLFKTNAKLNGQNQVIMDGQRPQVFINHKTMVVGADVTHSGWHNPLARERVMSSIAAVVGTYDSDFTKFAASVSAQPMNTEIIHDFDVMFGQLLAQFFKHNKCYPQIIVLFRDGVSESQLDTVMEREVPLINRAYQTQRVGFSPKILVFVVQKRHHTRVLVANPEKDWKGNESFNPKSGTVIDNTIINPFLDEFVLYSQIGRLGTSRPAKYVGLRDDIHLSKDDIQKFAFSMCFAYVRCSTPISIPIPVRYADDAAYRAKRHLSAQTIEYERQNPNETEEQRLARERRILSTINEKIKVSENIVFLPYYC